MVIKMAYILQKYKSAILLTLLLSLVFTILYTFTNKNINAIPEKAVLVFNSSSDREALR